MSRRPAAVRMFAGMAVAAALVAVLTTSVPAAAQSEVEVASGIRYATHGGVVLMLDAYLPPGRGPFPAVIVIPGGKWVEIDRTKHADVPTYFAQHGIAAFAIDYRSALEFPYPAAVKDVASAIRWVRAHAGDYDVDGTELGAVGVSSGGHLAALVAAKGTGPLDTGSRVNVVASWSGPMDLRPLVDSDDEELRSAVRTFLGCSASEPCSEVAGRASPIAHVDASDPPMVLVNGSDEIIPVDQAESMAAALESTQVDSRVTIAQGGHGAGYGGGNKILDQVIPYIQAWLTGQEAPASDTQDAGGSTQPSTGGKGAVAPAPTTVPPGSAPAQGSKAQGPPVTGAPRAAARGGATAATTIVAIAMIAFVIVMIQLFVIARLRRRVAASTSVLAGDGAAPAATVEGA